LREFLTGLSARVRYLRFFSGAPPVSQAMLRILTGGAGCTDALVATENGEIIGHAMASDTKGDGGSHRTEIGVVVADGRRGMGVGSALMRCLLARAQERGATVLVMEVLAENRQVITMITDHWPVTYRDQSGAYLTIHARLPEAGRDKPGSRPYSDAHARRPAHSRATRHVGGRGGSADGGDQRRTARERRPGLLQPHVP
jgi:GNAT superfamily N-acetyltransferase